MKKKKKGDLLEWMIEVLEQALATNQSTKIFRKHKLKDQHGIKREIDIYVETEANGKKLSYAFECKDHKKGIQLSHITDFASKIENLGIKGYFVSVSNYQSGAAEKANRLGITLLHVKKRNSESDDIKGVILIAKRYEITGIKVYGHLHEGAKFNEEDRIENCPHCSLSILKAVKEDVIPLLSEQLELSVEAMHPEFADPRKLSTTIGIDQAKELSLLVEFEKASITHKGIKLEYDWLQIFLKTWNDLIQKKPEKQNLYSDLGSDFNSILDNFSITEFALQNQSLILGLTKLKDGSKKMNISTGFDTPGKTVNVSYLGSIDELGLKKFLEDDTIDPC